MKSVVSVFTAICLLSIFSAGVYAENEKKESSKKNKKEHRLRKYFGKKGKSGVDYTSQSTAGISGATGEGLKVDEIEDETIKLKQQLYSDTYNNVNSAIDNFIQANPAK